MLGAPFLILHSGCPEPCKSEGQEMPAASDERRYSAVFVVQEANPRPRFDYLTGTVNLCYNDVARDAAIVTTIMQLACHGSLASPSVA